MSVSNGTPKKIIDRIVKGLIVKMNLTDAECYPAIAPAYVSGQTERVIQVVDGTARPDGRGQGGQEGGALIRRKTIRIVVWWRVHFDMKDMSRELLTREHEGMLDFLETVKNVLSHTFLGENVLIEPLFNEGETENQWYDKDRGIVRKDLIV